MLAWTMMTLALAGDAKPAPVTVTVTDEAGAVVPAARVRFLEEDELHLVNSGTGMFTTSVLYLRDGSEKVLEKGSTHAFEVVAPGYQRFSGEVVFDGRKEAVAVTLSPMEAPTASTPAGERAMEAYAELLAAKPHEEGFLLASRRVVDAAGRSRRAGRAPRRWPGAPRR